MNEIIRNVLARKNEILSKTMEYEKYNNSCVSTNNHKKYSQLYNFFDEYFNDDEIMVVQAIMYFGRDCFPDGEPECGGTVEEIINRWMRELGFSFGKKINKEIEIDQMVEKGLKIGTYFSLAFEYLEKTI